MYTYKQETRTQAVTIIGNLNSKIMPVTQYVIRDDQGKVYGTAPVSWSEQDVRLAVEHMNANELAWLELRAELGEDGYARYQDDNDAG